MDAVIDKTIDEGINDDDDDDDDDVDGSDKEDDVVVRKRVTRGKFRRAVRRLVMLHKLEQLPPATIASGHHRGSHRTANKASVNWRKSIAAGLLAARAEKSMDALIKEQSNIYQYNDLRKGAVDDRMPCCVIHPDSSARLAWDVIMLSLVVFFGFMVPYRIGFTIKLTPAEDTFDIVADALFLVDILLNFRTAYKDDGILVTDGAMMASNYAKSWFAIDFIASFPIGWFTDTGGVNKIIRMLRLFKLFRMLRLLRLFPRFTQMLEASIKFNPSMIRFLRSFAIMFLMWHNIGCTYWFVAGEELNGLGTCPVEYNYRTCYVNHCVCDPNDPVDSVVILPNTNVAWLDPENPDNWVPHFSMASATIGLQYAQAVFWAVVVTTGIGYDIEPKSQVEVFFTGFMVIVGLMMYSLIIGSASSALANIDSTATQRRQTLEKVNAFMRSRKVPNFFQRIIVDFYEHMWQTPQREADVFRDLPPSLRSRLAIVMNRDLIDRIPIFKLMSASVYVRIVQRLQHNTFLPGEFVIKQGTESDFLFFVKRGKCDALLPNTEHTIYMTLFPGDVFGEQGVIFDERRSESYRAVDFLDVLMMADMDFHELVVMAPSFVTELRRIAATRERRRLSFELTLLRKAADTGHNKDGLLGLFRLGHRRKSSSIVKAKTALGEFAGGSTRVAPEHACNVVEAARNGQSSVAMKPREAVLSKTAHMRQGVTSVLPSRAELAASTSPAERHRNVTGPTSRFPVTNEPSMTPCNLDGSKRDLPANSGGGSQSRGSTMLFPTIDGSNRSLTGNTSVSSHGWSAGLQERGLHGHHASIQAWRETRDSDS